MNHSLFAGFFCTLAFIILFIEISFLKKDKLPDNFFIFYLIGCLGWLSLSLYTSQMSLLFISLIQMVFCFICFKFNKGSYE